MYSVKYILSGVLSVLLGVFMLSYVFSPVIRRWAKRQIDRRRLDKLMPASFGYDVKQSSVFGCECCICIEEFAQGDRCRLLPGCSHVFHAACIDRWFEEALSCPVCRVRLGSSSSKMNDERV